MINKRTWMFILGAFILGLVLGSDEDIRSSNSLTSSPSEGTNQVVSSLPVKALPKKLTELEVSTTERFTPETNTRPANIEKKKVVPGTKAIDSLLMYVDASRLNVRNAASKTGKVIWTLKRDQKVVVTDKDGPWLYVKGNRYAGWVYGTYLTPKPTPVSTKKQKKPVTTAKTGLTNEKIKKILIQRSHAYYSGNCPCPYNRTKSGRKCGKRSAYSRPGGASPLCYASDISEAMVAEYRARN